MNFLIVGGTFASNPDDMKPSGVALKMFAHIANTKAYMHCMDVHIVNGGPTGSLEGLVNMPITSDADVTVWMPNIPNEEEKHYPNKKRGSVLICSKVMRKGYTRADSVSRIFKMYGNAVIEIRKEDGLFTFTLVDALANVWYDGSDIPSLVTAIMAFTAFTKAAKRVTTSRACETYIPVKGFFDHNRDNLEKLLEINKKLQEHIHTSCGSRFFGNVSTRCQKLFPSARLKDESNHAISYEHDKMYVSPRNTDKQSLTPEDMVLYFGVTDSYVGEKKPSVDAPAQVRLYQKMPNINFMIHGHAEIGLEESVTTKHYKLCGDINEVEEILRVVDKDSTGFIVNLLGHGFLIGADTPDKLNRLVNKAIGGGHFKITNQ